VQKIVIITDAWAPQVNGVVRTYENICKELEKKRQPFDLITPYHTKLKRKTLKGYEEIELVVNPWKIKQLLWIAMYEGHKIHIATEGPLGLYARYLLNKHNYPYTTSFHTLFPEFIKKRIGLPLWLSYAYFRWFHNTSKCVMVPTKGMITHLNTKGFKFLKLWTRGVDSELFNPKRRKEGKPFILCVSRISKEKNLDAFCKLTGRKVVIGDGPYLESLKKKYPDVEYLGIKQGEELAEWYASADVFVFPSKTDTFGIVILESISSGTPVAAYEEPGPLEAIEPMYNGMYGENLQHNVSACYSINRREVYESSKKWTWEHSTKQFLEAL